MFVYNELIEVSLYFRYLYFFSTIYCDRSLIVELPKFRLHNRLSFVLKSLTMVATERLRRLTERERGQSVKAAKMSELDSRDFRSDRILMVKVAER